MPEATRRKDPQPQPLFDPEPLSLALGIVSALVALRSLAAHLHQQRREEEHGVHDKRQRLRNAVHRAQRSLNACRTTLHDLASFPNQLGQIRGEFRPGAAPLIADARTAQEIRRLHDRILSAGRTMREGFLELSELLDDRDHEIVLQYLQDIDELVRRCLHSTRYYEFARYTSRLIDVTDHLLVALADANEIQLLPSDDLRRV